MNGKIPRRVFMVGQGERHERLDVWLASKLDGLSRQKAKSLIESGGVTVNRKKAGKSDLLEPGSEVEIWTEPSPAEWSPKPNRSMPLEIAYEDKHLAAVVKPAGIPSVPLSPKETETLANAVVARFPECRSIGRSQGDAGLVQRLDRETSGVVLVARSPIIHDRLVEMQNKGGVKKRYLALVSVSERNLPSAIESALASAGPGGSRVKISEKGPLQTTELRALKRIGGLLLVEAIIYKGFRHQVRVHLASAGFPIAGDKLYGGETPRRLERLFLHAQGIYFAHPETGADVAIDSPLPAELATFLETI